MLRRGASASCRRGCRGAHRSRRPGRPAARQRSHGALIPLSHADRVLLTVPAQVGYPALAALVLGESAGLPLPGESALLAAAGLAAAGQLALPLVIAVAAGAAILGDVAGYALGRRGGRAFLVGDGWLADHRRHAIERADRFFARHGIATVFFARWIPGVRVVAALMAGATRMPWRRFAVANALGALAWATTVATTAYLVGPAGAAAFGALGLIAALSAAAVSWWRRRGRRRAAAALTA